MKCYCLIDLTPLKASEQASGYSQKGLKMLFGSKKSRELPFTRQAFIQEQPVLQQGMSISGYQPKLSLKLENQQLLVANNHGTYILKPSPEAYPHLAENEHATMTVMRRLGFAVPPFGLLRFQQNEMEQEELAFIIQRYDRISGSTIRIHQEQLDGAMGISDKYGYLNGRKAVSYERIAAFFARHVNHSLQAKRELFLRIVYAYVLGNNDLHLRNFSILYPENQAAIIAPIYDFVSVVAYPTVFSDYLALPLLASEENEASNAAGIDSVYGEYIGLDFIQLAQNIGVQTELAKKWLDSVIQSHALIIETYQQSYMPQEQQTLVLAYVARRMRLLAVTAL